MKLHVAFVGSYDDRALVGVFDTEEEAVAACNKAVHNLRERWGNTERTDIEVVELNVMKRDGKREP